MSLSIKDMLGKNKQVNSIFRKVALPLVSLFFGYSLLPGCGDASACTSLIVGKKASADGSVIISYNADDYGMFGFLPYLPAAKHKKGDKRAIYDVDTNRYWCDIDEAPETYSVMDLINEHQVSIGETTFGGRPELFDTTGVDYGSLMHIALQRSKTAREAIKVMSDIVARYGYASEGESFTVADPNEAWIMEMVGKGKGGHGAVWVALRVPDDCICAHANQSRIHKFNMKDKANCMYSPDVVSFARKKGLFNGKDADFDFANTYCPAGFAEIRYCEARVWSFFNKWSDGMDRYLEYAKGEKLGLEPMPLFVKPKRLLSVRDVVASMRDHYEGTPLSLTADCGMGPYESPYRPTPLEWSVDSTKYFNERPISTQQTGRAYIMQMRSWLPDAIGGVLWYGNDDPNMIAYTPIYCGSTHVPDCYSGKDADGVTFSWKSAFWVCNWISNMVYPRYSMLFPDLKKAQTEMEDYYFNQQKSVEEQAQKMYQTSPEQARDFLDRYTSEAAQKMMTRWQKLGEFLIVKYNDQTIRPETDGKFERTETGLGKAVIRVGYPDKYRRLIIKETGKRYQIPKQ